MKTTFLSNALAAARAGLASSPAALIAIGVAAGLSSTQAKAWGSEYEQIGRTVGGELGRSAGNGYSATSRVAGMIGEVIGGALAKPMDQQAEADRRDAENIARAKAQAQHDAAYTAERRRLDPTHGTTTYGEMIQRSSASGSYASDIAANIRVITDRANQAGQDYTFRNSSRSR